jgi:hypothetical protein
MAIIVMLSNTADAFPEGAHCALDYVNAAGADKAPYAVVLATEHVGAVLNLSERNCYDDSDFMATVWNFDKGEPETFCYASTRGWSYPCYGSWVDATPEVITLYKAWQADQETKRLAAVAAYEARTPAKGKRARVIAGRKLPVGTEAEIFWFGVAREFGSCPRGGYKARARDDADYGRSLGHRYGVGDPRSGMRVGLLVDGNRVFVNAENIEVIA